FTHIGTTEAHSNKCVESKQEGDDDSHSNQEEEGIIGVKKHCSYKNSKEGIEESFCTGFNMEECMKNMEEIIESQGGNVVHR
ncbi:hypothetical protein Tco_0325498, partial [Tanacetum coccineum]